MNHVRADRWYKLGRTILYGRLEDEAPFQSVRRLVQYEDYALRLLRDAGIPTAHADRHRRADARARVPARHRVLRRRRGDRRRRGRRRDHRRGPGARSASSGTPGSPTATSSRPTCSSRTATSCLIDVAFVQVRPSPWRQAVDLANMMLVLAVRTDAERVYDRALAVLHPGRDRRGVRRRPRHRQPDAAAHGDEAATAATCVAQFRALAPARRPISLQRWSAAPGAAWPLGSSLVAVLALTNVYSMFTPAELPIDDEPTCGTERRDDPHGAVRAVGDRGAVRRVAARRLDGRRRCSVSAATGSSGSTPTRPATTPSR